jgi:hypothetical protein
MWIEVTQSIFNGNSKKNLINSDLVERCVEKVDGCYLEMNSGFTVEIEESLDYWKERAQ